jgi:hypothetical protein
MPYSGGCWIATRTANIEVMQIDHAHFSHRHFDLPINPNNISSIPLSLDTRHEGIVQRGPIREPCRSVAGTVRMADSTLERQ